MTVTHALLIIPLRYSCVIWPVPILKLPNTVEQQKLFILVSILNNINAHTFHLLYSHKFGALLRITAYFVLNNLARSVFVNGKQIRTGDKNNSVKVLYKPSSLFFFIKLYCSQGMQMDQMHWYISYNSSIVSILKCQVLYHRGDYEKHTLFLHLRGPSFRVANIPFSALFFWSPMGVYVRPHGNPPPPPRT